MKNKTLSNIVFLIILTFILKGIGFVNRIIIARYFGTSAFIDTYYIATGLIDVFTAILVSSLSVGIVTISIGYKEDSVKFTEFIASVLIIAETFILFCFCLIFLFSKQISFIYLPKSTPEQVEYLGQLLRIFSPLLFLLGMTSILTAALQSKQIFMPEKIIGAISSISSIVVVVTMSGRYAEKSLIIAYVSAGIINCLYILLNVKRIVVKINIHIYKCLKNEDIRKLATLSLPLFIGLAAHEGNLLIDKFVAYSLGEGNVSAMAYGSTLYLFAENIIIANVVTVLFPNISKLFVDGKHEEIANQSKSSILFSELLLIPITLVFFFFGETIVRVIYMHGKFNFHAVKLTSAVLAGYGIGLPFLLIKDVLTRIIYAYGKTKIPLYVNIFAVILNIILDFLLSELIGIMGVALATSISNLFSASISYIIALRINPLLKTKISFFKILFIIVALGLCCLCCVCFSQNNNILSLIFSVIIIYCIELLGIRIFLPEYYFNLLEIIKRIAKR